MKINQNGRSMVEMLGVLAIIGVLSVGSVAGYSKAMFKYKLNKTINHITMITSGVFGLYVNASSFEGLDENIIKKTHIVPEELYTEPKFVGYTTLFLKHAFGDNIYINSDENDKIVNIVFFSMPEEACIPLFSYDWSGIDGIRGIGWGVRNSIPKNCTNGDRLSGGITSVVCTFPISIALADQYCKGLNIENGTAKSFQITIEK